MSVTRAVDIETEDFAPPGFRGMILIPEEGRRRAGVAQRVESFVVAAHIPTQSPRLRSATGLQGKQKSTCQGVVDDVIESGPVVEEDNIGLRGGREVESDRCGQIAVVRQWDGSEGGQAGGVSSGSRR